MKGKVFKSFIYLSIIKWSFIRKNILLRTLQKCQHLKHEKWVQKKECDCVRVLLPFFNCN